MDLRDASLDGGCEECVHVQNEVLWPIAGIYTLQLSVRMGVLDEFLRKFNRLTQSLGCKARLSKVQLVGKTRSTPEMTLEL